MSLDLEEVRRLIRETENPDDLQSKLKGMIEAVYPVKYKHNKEDDSTTEKSFHGASPVLLFQDGEVVPMHVFEGRFKKHVCQGNETRYLQWPVQVFVTEDGFHLWLKVGESK